MRRHLALRPKQRRNVSLAVCVAALAFAGNGSVVAQTAPGNPGQPNSVVPEKVAPPSPAEASPEITGTNGGVLTPKRDVDPKMSKTPPSNSGNTPVVQPKGTPGGPPGPEPK